MTLLGQHHWTPSREFLLEHLQIPRRKRIKFQSFPKGLDNAHIDVWLGTELTKAIDALVVSSLGEQMQALQIPGASQVVDVDVVERFREVYAATSLAAAQRARETLRRELYQLFHLAVVKQMLVAVDAQLVSWREEIEGAMHETDGFAPTPARPPERLSLFRRYHPRLRFLVSKEVLSILHTQDRVDRKRRKSILALSWPVAEEMLFNPLLWVGDLRSEENFIALYPPLFLDPDNFQRFNHIVQDLLAEWLPDYCLSTPEPIDAEDLKSLPMRRDEGDLCGYAQVEAYLRRVMAPLEYGEDKVCWLDHPQNLIDLLGGEAGRPLPGPWRHSQWPGFQDTLWQGLERRLEEAGLLEALLASVQLQEIYPDLARRGPPNLLLDYLRGTKSCKELASALQKLKEIPNLDLYLGRLEQAFKQLRSVTPATRRQWLMKAVGGYARLRRDMKLAWQAYRAMDAFRLVDSARDLELSRANGLLQDFTPGEDVPDRVCGHVIIKADLRGSTELIAGMNSAGLNPAAYFSKNLFEPVNSLLKQYGAEKVFLEGDAVILMIPDHSDKPGHLVARACGLAFDLIALVIKRNRENRHMGLPELELGVGITYVDEAPTYLFDEGRKITISPAINRADRLSSCSLGRDFPRPSSREKGWGVEVVRQRHSANDFSGAAELRRYNVNGIELDLPAFLHLKGEMALKKVKAASLGGDSEDRYFLGRFPDLSGKTQWLALRESPVKWWDGSELTLKDKGRTQKFYEVVTAPELVRQIRARLGH